MIFKMEVFEPNNLIVMSVGEIYEIIQSITACPIGTYKGVRLQINAFLPPIQITRTRIPQSGNKNGFPIVQLIINIGISSFCVIIYWFVFA